MNTLITDQTIAFIAVIEQAGLPALRAVFSIAALVFLVGGVLIFRRRHQFFDRDPNDMNNFKSLTQPQNPQEKSL